MAHDHRPHISLASVADLLAAVPYLFGFHVDHSIVIVGYTESMLTAATRADLPKRDEVPSWIDGTTSQSLAMLRNVDATAATIIGYGPADTVTPIVDILTPHFDHAGITVRDALRVTDGRYYSYLCDDPACCPVDGVPFDAVGSVVAVNAIVAGQTALPDRAALVASIAPTTGAARDAVTTATWRAQHRRDTLFAAGRRAAVIRAGKKALRAAVARYAGDRVLTDDEVAWLSVLLLDYTVRDAAWRTNDGAPSQLALWTDVTRRVDPALAAPPAVLLAVIAWREGLGALASVAIDRALDADPNDPLAQLIDHALRAGIPPTALDSQATPTTPAENPPSTDQK
ncbi:DUF4192 domain-containing protein [Micromonospora sp. NPDC049275]|uniref:DUF4192 domain-containing protein n=1 Tax=Micromonospora sp. NPDC049275 TaxID=3364268 RepID=UPI00371C67AF